jgi:hypothetical protein
MKISRWFDENKDMLVCIFIIGILAVGFVLDAIYPTPRKQHKWEGIRPLIIWIWKGDNEK